ncbi:inositol monophosphatase family protein [Jatrophihabitans fulvus]
MSDRVRPEREPLVDELAVLTVELARRAGTLVSDGQARGFGTESKSTGTDLVTEVDRRVEQWLLDELSERRPDDAVLGEERGGREGTSGVRWLLDPIDGTVNFVLGIPQFAVSVAAELDGTVVAGAVCNPVSGELFRARIGAGAFLGDERLGGPRGVPLERAVIATGFGYDAGLRSRQVAAVVPLLPRIADLRRLGSAALDLCFLAAGRLDGYFEAGLNPWDYAAGALVATEAGCVVTHPDGVAFERFLVAAGADVADELLELLVSLGAADALPG